MCLAIPARIVSLQGMNAQVEIMDITQEVNIQLIDSPKVGDHVLVHAGFAIQRVNVEHYNDLVYILEEMLSEVNNYE